MLDGLYAKLIVAGGLVALLLGAYVFVHHQGAESQKAADQAEIAHKNAALAAASDALTAAAHTFDSINADAAAQVAAAKASAQRSAVAIADAQRAATQQAQAAAAWRHKFQAVVKTKDCAAALEQTLCPEVFEPFSPSR